ncbi:MAG: hypothetical protein KUG58_05920 [Marinosulfonomonas sp.]|nr:hypothetical protein [Marinosulfonomonas sp.]
MIKFLNIICYKWGSKYTAKQVNILHASVGRNLSVPHKFICITDDPSGLDSEIATAPFPKQSLIGNGPKIFTFSADFLGLGPNDFVVSLDIDIVIVGSLDFLAQNPELDFVIAKHRVASATSRGHGAVYRLRVGSHRHIWDSFAHDPEKWAEAYPGRKNNRFSEQRWLEHHFKDKEMDFFPANKILIYRTDCNSRSFSRILGRKAGRLGITAAFMGQAKLPGIGESIVSFSGETKPWDVIERHHRHLKYAPFVAEFWY